MIKNCPVTLEDIEVANKIYGPDVAVLKGKSVRKKPIPVIKDYVEIPKEIKEIHQEVELCADIICTFRRYNFWLLFPERFIL